MKGIREQKQFLQTHTCELEIANSKNIHCTGKGFYLIPKIQVSNTCKANYYLSGSRTVSCTKPSKCLPCKCDSKGSTTSQCSDQSGKCTCKTHFYTRRNQDTRQCMSRNCKWGPWKSSKCCGTYSGKSFCLIYPI